MTKYDSRNGKESEPRPGSNLAAPSPGDNSLYHTWQDQARDEAGPGQVRPLGCLDPAALVIEEIEEPEIGEEIEISTPGGEFSATWLGSVSNGKELAAAMRLAAAICEERAIDDRR